MVIVSSAAECEIRRYTHFVRLVFDQNKSKTLQIKVKLRTLIEIEKVTIKEVLHLTTTERRLNYDYSTLLQIETKTR